MIVFTAPSISIKVQSKLERVDLNGINIVKMQRCAATADGIPNVDGVSTYIDGDGNVSHLAQDPMQASKESHGRNGRPSIPHQSSVNFGSN